MIIVTGGAGFIGSAVVWELNRCGVTDILIVDRLGNEQKWKNLVNLSFSNFMDRGHFLEMLRRDSLPQRPSAIIHMGACSSTTETDADFLIQNNLHYSQEVCKYAVKAGIRMIHASSAATYGNGSQGFSDDLALLPALRPLNMYGYSKHLFDLWALRERMEPRIAALKFFNVYGPNEYHKNNMRSMVCKAYSEIESSGRIRLFKSNSAEYADGGQMRDFIYVKDCARTICWLLDKPEICGIFNLGTGRARSWNDLAGAVFSSMQLPVHIDYVDMPANLSRQYQNFTEAKMSKLIEHGLDMGSFHSLEEGVADYVQNYLMHPDNPYLGNNPETGL
ncbi:MAG: ADP-glyceromanno-heptose 6-epimerase [Desulfovibrionaceae bacterium]|nr:ADP-glyceromanno-heptose 6-epimerase [Desulfovibrionaceae bacterium]